MLHSWVEAFEAILTTGDAERLRLIVQTSIPSGEDEDDILWQLIPLGSRFILHHTFGDEGNMLVKRLQLMKQRVSQEKNRIALIKVRRTLTKALPALFYRHSTTPHSLSKTPKCSNRVATKYQQHNFMFI